MAPPQSGYSSTEIWIELEFGNVDFWWEGKTGVPGEKPLGAEKRTNNKLNLHITSSGGIDPESHRWRASALTTAPSLLPSFHLSWTFLSVGRASNAVFLFVVFSPFFFSWLFDLKSPKVVMIIASVLTIIQCYLFMIRMNRIYGKIEKATKSLIYFTSRGWEVQFVKYHENQKQLSHLFFWNS